MITMVQIILKIPDSVLAKGTTYTRGYQFGAWIPFIVFAVIATLIIIKKKKS